MAVGNLLRNACLYTEQGRIEVRLAPGELSVVDSGPGLPPAVRAQLFERLVRGDAQAAAGGAGLGLALVKRIADHLGWCVELVASDAGGSHFRLRFPG
jgi:signal transduction histidine kinase